jgi:hypothetical protein
MKFSMNLEINETESPDIDTLASVVMDVVSFIRSAKPPVNWASSGPVYNADGNVIGQWIINEQKVG